VHHVVVAYDDDGIGPVLFQSPDEPIVVVARVSALRPRDERLSPFRGVHYRS